MLSITHTTLTGNVPEASELGTILDKLFIPNGVHYRGVNCIAGKQQAKIELDNENQVK